MFNAPDVLTALRDFAAGATGFTITIGLTEGFGRRASGYVDIGAMPVIDRAAGGLVERSGEFIVVLGYRVKGAEQGAVEAIAKAIDDLQLAYYASDRRLGGVAESSSAEFLERPDWQDIVGLEYRMYPIVFVVKQQQSMAVGG
jgi:hypothetical protein